jgi:hypothetical protein
MNEFIARYKDRISGVLRGFDRLVLRGNLSLNHESGMKGYLWANHIAWKDYAGHVEQVSQRVKRASHGRNLHCPEIIPGTSLSSTKRCRDRRGRDSRVR